MKSIKCDLPYFDSIEILPLSDLHIGDSLCDYGLIKERIDYIRSTPNCFCILDGDLMDTAIASSIGDTYAANLQPMEQLKRCVEIFEPIKKKILAVLPGNHENRVYKSDGLDITEIMCAQLGISERYSPTTALLFVRFGKNNKGRKQLYTIYVTHGTGGGRKEGGKVNRVAELACIVDADCYVMGHVHQPTTFKEAFYRVNYGNSSVACEDKLFVICGAALKYGGYGDKGGFKPASLATPHIYMDGRKRDLYGRV